MHGYTLFSIVSFLVSSSHEMFVKEKSLVVGVAIVESIGGGGCHIWGGLLFNQGLGGTCARVTLVLLKTFCDTNPRWNG